MIDKSKTLIMNSEEFKVSMEVRNGNYTDPLHYMIYPIIIKSPLDISVFIDIFEGLPRDIAIEVFEDYQRLGSFIEHTDCLTFKDFTVRLLDLTKEAMFVIRLLSGGSNINMISIISNFLTPLMCQYCVTTWKGGDIPDNTYGYIREYGFIGSCLNPIIDYIDSRYKCNIIDNLQYDYGLTGIKEIFNNLHLYHLEDKEEKRRWSKWKRQTN